MLVCPWPWPQPGSSGPGPGPRPGLDRGPGPGPDTGPGTGLGIHLRIPMWHGVELTHWSHDQPDFAHLADFGQVAVQVHETTGRVVSVYDITNQ